MQGDWLAKRVEMLENTVNGPDGLVAKVDRLQTDLSTFHVEFLQFREWTKMEFSAVRREMTDGFMAVGAQIEAGDRETRNFMRVLYEDLVSRIAMLQAGIARRHDS